MSLLKKYISLNFFVEFLPEIVVFLGLGFSCLLVEFFFYSLFWYPVNFLLFLGLWQSVVTFLFFSLVLYTVSLCSVPISELQVCKAFPDAFLENEDCIVETGWVCCASAWLGTCLWAILQSAAGHIFAVIIELFHVLVWIIQSVLFQCVPFLMKSVHTGIALMVWRLC